MSEMNSELRQPTRTLEELKQGIDDCRRRILEQLGIEWDPEGGRDADQR